MKAATLSVGSEERTIAADVLYSLDDLKARTGFRDDAMREARRGGLKVLYVGGRGFVKGSDFMDWASVNAATEYQRKPSQGVGGRDHE